MKAITMTISVITGFALGVNVVSAQSSANDNTPPRPALGPTLVQHHASTFEEGYLRGWADVTRAAGEYNHNSSLANIYQQEANRRAILNKRLYTQTYFEIKEVNRQAREKTRGKRVTQQQVTKFNQSRLPARLTAHEYHIATRNLRWPPVLKDDLFAPERTAIDKAMGARTPDDSGLGTASQREIKQLAIKIEDKIRDLGNQLSSSERIAARKFLKSLAYEAQFAVSIDVAKLAGN